MEPSAFLEDLAEEVGPEAEPVLEQELLLFMLRGFPGSVRLVSEDRVLMTVDVVPCHRLLLTPETDVTLELARLGIPHETRIGVPDVDDRYVIKNAPEEKARIILGPEFLQALRGIEPFLEFEMGARNYRLVKEMEPGYDAVRAARDLDGLVELAERTQVC